MTESNPESFAFAWAIKEWSRLKNPSLNRYDAGHLPKKFTIARTKVQHPEPVSNLGTSQHSEGIGKPAALQRALYSITVTDGDVAVCHEEA
jgi:hypothetical protein